MVAVVGDVKTELTREETDALVDRIADWAAALGIGPLVSVLLEMNRPVCSITGNVLIAGAPIAATLAPWPLHPLGLLLQDSEAVARLQDRLREKAP